MTRRLLCPILIWAILALIAGMLGCGRASFGEIPGDACGDAETGDRIRLQNSQLSCDDAYGIYVLLGTMEHGTQAIDVEGDKWSCTAFPKAWRPLKFRCRLGDMHFEIVEDPSNPRDL